MKKILFLILLCLTGMAYGQTIGYLRYDTVKVMKNGGRGSLDVTGSVRFTGLLAKSASTDSVIVRDSNGYLGTTAKSAFGTPSWALLGNSGTTAGTNFIGTTDDEDFVIKTNGAEIARFRASLFNVQFGYIPDASGQYSTVSGGSGNESNNIGTTVGGGISNVSSGVKATISGGESNTASGTLAFIGGGSANFATGQWPTVGGGDENRAGDYGTVGGGTGNFASGTGASILGGESNIAYGEFSSILGGALNTNYGAYSASMGLRNKSKSFAGTVVGQFNDSTNATSSTAYTATNRAFEIGVGTADNARANAMTVLFNGKTGIGTTTPDSLLTVEQGIWGKRGVRLTGLIQTGLDTANYKIAAVHNTTGNMVKMYWPTSGGSGSPAGSNTQIQFNDGGSFGADAGLVFNKTSGSVGIGTAPSFLLDVRGSGTEEHINIQGSGTGSIKIGTIGGTGEFGAMWAAQASPTVSNYAFLGNASFSIFNVPSGGSINFRVNNSDQMVISSAGALRLNAYGAGTLVTDGSGNVTATSDMNVKHSISPFRLGLNEIMNVTPSNYIRNSDATNSIETGFIAQNIRDAFGGFGVGKDINGNLTLNNNVILAAAVNAIRELKRKNDDLQAQITELINKK